MNSPRTFHGLSLTVVALLCLAATTVDAGDDSVVSGRYIIRLKDAGTDIQAFAGEHSAVVHLRLGLIRGFAATVPLHALGKLLGDGRVAAVEADGFAWAFGDRGSALGKGSSSPPAPQVIPSGVARIHADQNTQGHTGSGVKVAVVDTGIQLNHPDLAGNIKGNVSFVSGTRNGDDDNGHGTHVAGIVAALDNTAGVRGVAPRASLYAVKVLDRRGSGTYSAIIAGIDWAVANRMHVVNMSLGGSASSDALHAALLRAKSAGVTVVVAAGNEGTDANLSYPAAYDDAVLTVSALKDGDDTFPTWSNHGVPPVDLAAPGVAIYSTYKGSGYASLSGTSMACPHVTGSVALWVEGQLASGLPWTPDDVAMAMGVLAVPVTGNNTLHPEPLVQADGL